MDWSSLIPEFEQYGAPLIAKLLTQVAYAAGGPLVGSVAGVVLNAAASALGAASNSAADIQTAIDADPTKAATVLPQVEADHQDVLQNAVSQAELDEKNTENARSTELALAQAHSPLAWVPVGVTGIAFVGMACITYAQIHGWMPDNITSGRVEGFWETIATAAFFFWIGSSNSARTRADQAIDYAHKAAPPTAAPPRRK